MNLRQAAAFREDALNQGLIVLDEVVQFHFTLGTGPMILVNPTPHRVMVLVALARKYADDDMTGEHDMLLRLVAYRRQLGHNVIIWFRPSEVFRSEPTVSLREWLIEQGENPDQVFHSLRNPG